MTVDFGGIKKYRQILPLACGILTILVIFNVSHAQSVAPAPNPIVDPLSEMTPSAAGETDDGILDLDIEHLGNVAATVPAFDTPVSSVSKQESTIGKSPAAVYVITSEMIHRSGAECIPEALRMAPGVTVCQNNACQWSVSIRGFNDGFSNKLLVMIDGRSVYNAFFSGVYWNNVDMPMDNIERIEVIRGPGGTLWGNNAVNGVINIITKSAAQTQGSYVKSGGGSWIHNISTVRQGGELGENAKYNIWGKFREAGPEFTTNRSDDFRQGRGGFRVDWNPGGSKKDLITTEGNFFGGEEGFSEPQRYDGSAENALQARWEHIIDDESDWALETYYDQLWRDNSLFGFTLNTFCVDFQHRFPIGEKHNVIWGTEYYRVQNYFVPQPTNTTFSFTPPAQVIDTPSWFVQDEIELIEDKFTVTIGSKFENNYFTGFEYQPSIRGLWQLDDRHVLWGAVSRAVRTPSLVEENAHQVTPFIPDFNWFFLYNSSKNLKSENVMAYELGYRAQTTDRFAWDIALFCNVYHNLMFYEYAGFEDDGSNRYFLYDIRNGGHGEAYGFEWTASFEATENWRLGGSYSFLYHKDYYAPPGEFFTLGAGSAANDPRNQARLQSYWSFAPNWQLDAFLRYVDPVAPGQSYYTTMDLRLGWRPNKNLEFSIVGENLFDQYHAEAREFPDLGIYNQITRAVFAKVTWTR